jgi:hypothetical protein
MRRTHHLFRTVAGAAMVTALVLRSAPDRPVFTSVEWQTNRTEAVPLPDVVLSVPHLDVDPEAPDKAFRDLREHGLRLPFITYPNGGSPLLGSTAYVAFSDAFFVALLEGRQSPEYEVRANPQEVEDGHIWYDDNFEVFVDPFLTRSEYIHFIVNPLGDVFDQRCFEKLVPDPKAADPSETMAVLQHDVSYASGARVPVERTDSGWAALFCLPFGAFNLAAPPVGQVWGFNFCHTNRENDELTQWQATPGRKGFHQPRLFGALRFGESTGDLNVDFSLPLPGVGANVLHLETANRGPALDATCVITLSNARGTVISSETAPLHIPAGNTVHRVPFTAPKAIRGKCRIAAELRTGTDTLAYFVKNHAFRQPVDISLPLDQIYTTDPGVDGLLRLNLGEGSLDDLELTVRLTGPRKQTVRTILEPSGNAATFRLAIRDLPTGNYVLDLSAKNLGSDQAEFTIIPAPFDF